MPLVASDDVWNNLVRLCLSRAEFPPCIWRQDFRGLFINYESGVCLLVGVPIKGINDECK